MLTGFDLATARRMWFVPRMSVWGRANTNDIDFVAAETIGDTTSVYYGSSSAGQPVQEVLFSELTDHRGNQLPASLDAPVVLPRTRGEAPAYIVGRETSDRFRIAASEAGDLPVETDLMVIELGG